MADINAYEDRLAKQLRHPYVPPSRKELMLSFVVAILCTPFFAVVFFVLPMMGQILVGAAMLLTAWYFFVRRSILVALVAGSGGVLFFCLMFAIIDAVKYRLDIPLFIFLVLGVPLTFLYSIFIAMRIWVAKAGVPR